MNVFLKVFFSFLCKNISALIPKENFKPCCNAKSKSHKKFQFTFLPFDSFGKGTLVSLHYLLSSQWKKNQNHLTLFFTICILYGQCAVYLLHKHNTHYLCSVKSNIAKENPGIPRKPIEVQLFSAPILYSILILIMISVWRLVVLVTLVALVVLVVLVPLVARIRGRGANDFVGFRFQRNCATSDKPLKVIGHPSKQPTPRFNWSLLTFWHWTVMMTITVKNYFFYSFLMRKLFWSVGASFRFRRDFWPFRHLISVWKPKC